MQEFLQTCKFKILRKLTLRLISDMASGIAIEKEINLSMLFNNTLFLHILLLL
jgi:hypothetical protein